LAGETEVLGENLPQCRFVQNWPFVANGLIRSHTNDYKLLKKPVLQGEIVEHNLCSARKFPLPLTTMTSGKQLENVPYQVRCLLPPSAANSHNYIVTAWRDRRNVTTWPQSPLRAKTKNKTRIVANICVYTIQSKCFPMGAGRARFSIMGGGVVRSQQICLQTCVKTVNDFFLFTVRPRSQQLKLWVATPWQKSQSAQALI
jgi:hypothetical protein